jgi:hypothetical protein|tara:strand:- start:1906 stop:2022 length:117 start_codon:yes stop_codon:yes gene_type:complete
MRNAEKAETRINGMITKDRILEAIGITANSLDDLKERG